jgi:hypothetical protein
MTILFSNNASTTISGSITALDTTVALAAGSGVIFPHPVGGDYFVCTFYDQATKTINEIVHVTNITGDVATIVRAQEGTTAVSWNTGDIFANLITAGTLEAFVQAGTGPADTSIVYVGEDTGTPNHIVAVTNPVPANLAVGMLFNIRLHNANSGPTDMALNGLPAYPCKHTDGSDFSRADLFSGLEYTFVWNGVSFSSTIMNVPKKPPQFIFYVRSDSTSTLDSNGIESNTGFANTPTEAFKTIQGAINTISLLYISSQSVKIMVADGTYSSGFVHSTQYISQFEIQGNDANPGNCIINCTSNAQASYVPGAFVGVGAMSYRYGNLTVHGFTFTTWAQNCVANIGSMVVYNCNFTTPTSGLTGMVESANAGAIRLQGNIHVSTPTLANTVFNVQGGGVLALGFHATAQPQYVLNLYFDGTVNASYFLGAFTGGIISISNDSGAAGNTINVYGGPVHGAEYVVSNAAGIAFLVGTTYFPATSPGIIQAPGWVT